MRPEPSQEAAPTPRIALAHAASRALLFALAVVAFPGCAASRDCVDFFGKCACGPDLRASEGFDEPRWVDACRATDPLHVCCWGTTHFRVGDCDCGTATCAESASGSCWCGVRGDLNPDETEVAQCAPRSADDVCCNWPQTSLCSCGPQAPGETCASEELMLTGMRVDACTPELVVGCGESGEMVTDCLAPGE